MINSEFKVSELILLNIHTEKYFYFVMGENKNFLLCKSLYFLKNLKRERENSGCCHFPSIFLQFVGK